MFACLSYGLPTVSNTQLARLIKPINLFCLGWGLDKPRTDLACPEYFKLPHLTFMYR